MAMLTFIVLGKENPETATKVSERSLVAVAYHSIDKYDGWRAFVGHSHSPIGIAILTKNSDCK